MKTRVFGDIVELGFFELTGPVMRVSDPCYDRSVWCSGTVETCKVGTWEAAVLKADEGDWGVRNTVLAARFAEGGPKFEVIDTVVPKPNGAWHICDFEVGVDSGQAGLFDERHYHDDTIFGIAPDPSAEEGELWYDTCCNVTLSSMSAGVIPHGVVSSSGYGDGGYVAVKHLSRSGEIDFVFIVFIDD